MKQNIIFFCSEFLFVFPFNWRCTIELWLFFVLCDFSFVLTFIGASYEGSYMLTIDVLVQPWGSITRVCVYLHTILWPKIYWVILMHPLSTWMLKPNSCKTKKITWYVMKEKIWTWNLNGYLKLLYHLYSTHRDFKKDVPIYDIACSLCGSCRKRLTFSSTST